jgi:hypothetical protein
MFLFLFCSIRPFPQQRFVPTNYWFICWPCTKVILFVNVAIVSILNLLLFLLLFLYYVCCYCCCYFYTLFVVIIVVVLVVIVVVVVYCCCYLCRSPAVPQIDEFPTFVESSFGGRAIRFLVGRIHRFWKEMLKNVKIVKSVKMKDDLKGSF